MLMIGSPTLPTIPPVLVNGTAKKAVAPSEPRNSLSVLFIHTQGFGRNFGIDEPHGSSCFLPFVAMVEATDTGFPDNLGFR